MCKKTRTIITFGPENREQWRALGETALIEYEIMLAYTKDGVGIMVEKIES